MYLGGGAITLGKRGHFPSAEAQGGAVFPLNYIYCAQERWWASPYYQSEGPESLYTSSSLQDGGYTGPEGHSSPQRLHDKVGSKGCLPIDSNLSTPSEVPELHLEPSGLQVHMSPIRAIQCPPDLHKGHETRGGSPQVLGNQTGSVSGRHAVFSSVQGRAGPVEEHYPGSLREPGLPDKLPQISSGAIPDHEILRILSEHNYYATLPPQGEGGPDSQRGSEALTIGQCYSEAARSPDRSIHCHPTSSPSCPTTLSRAPGAETCHPEERGTRCIPTFNLRGTGGPGMVDAESSPNEWQGVASGATQYDPEIRRLPSRLGGSVSGPENRRSMDNGGEVPPHQLSGTSGSNFCSPGIRKRQAKCHYSDPLGQCHCSSLCEPHGRDKISPALCNGKVPLGLVPPEAHFHSSIPHSRSDKCGGRLSVQDSSRSPRLAAKPSNFSETERSLGSHGDRSLCFQGHQTGGQVLQLEARPSSGGSGCLQAELGRSYRVCQSSMGTCGQMPTTCVAGRSLNSIGDSLLACTSLVPSSLPTPPGLSQTLTGCSRSLGTSPPGVQDPTPRQGKSAGRLVHLRRSYQGAGVSEEAVSLLLASWRSSTTKNYNSSWRRWDQWCEKHMVNPISPSLGNILNFLAAEYSAGKCYRSLNCYRSALSSVLAPIDGFDVGRHPLVCRLLKGVFQQRPPKPKHSTFWSIETVLDHISSWGVNRSLSFQQLSWKLAMLLALSSASRSSDLSKLTLVGHRFSENGLVIYPSGLSKQSRVGHLPSPIEFRAFNDSLLCPVECFRTYKEVTRSLRTQPVQSGLFLALNRPHLPVTSSTVARWLKAVLSSAGVDTSHFSAHSTRGAAASAAAMAGVTMKQILETADWASAGTFREFYLKETTHKDRTPRQSFNVGSLISASKSRCDMEPEPYEVQSENG